MWIRTRELVLLPMLGAVLILAQLVMASLPNIEIVSLLIYIYAKVLGKKVLIPIYIFVFAQALIYGITFYWIPYLYVWSILAVVAIWLKDNDATIVCAIVTGLFGLAFGTLCSIPSFFVAGPGGGLAYILSGIPFDLAHFAGNIVVAFILYYPLSRVIRRLSGEMLRSKISSQ